MKFANLGTFALSCVLFALNASTAAAADELPSSLCCNTTPATDTYDQCASNCGSYNWCKTQVAFGTSDSGETYCKCVPNDTWCGSNISYGLTTYCDDSSCTPTPPVCSSGKYVSGTSCVDCVAAKHVVPYCTLCVTSIYFFLGLVFRIMSYKYLPKEGQVSWKSVCCKLVDEANEAITEPASKLMEEVDGHDTKINVEGKQKTVYDTGPIPIPCKNSVPWLLTKLGVITEDTNLPLKFKYFFVNTHEVASLCFGDPKVLQMNLRWRSFLFSNVTAFALSLVFASGNFGATEVKCSTQSSVSSTNSVGLDDQIEFFASILIPMLGISSVISMAGMDAFMVALQRSSKTPSTQSRGFKMSFAIEMSWMMILALCFFLEREATKDNTTATAAKYSESNFRLKQAAAQTGLLCLCFFATSLF
jgi:hypothetical protein